MNRKRCTRRAVLQAAGGLLLPVGGSALAQAVNYPTQPIRVILGGSPGGSSDSITRLVTQKLTDAWGQPFLHENITGASGLIAAETAARAAPNGYTLLAISSSLVVGSAVGEKTARSVNFRSGFAHITNMVSQPYVMVVNANLPVRNVTELVAYAKRNPGKVNFGSVGVGTPGHLGIELLKTMAGIDMVHVPYKGTNQVESDLAAGHVQLLLGGALSSMPLVKAGKTRALAVTSGVRSKLLPDLPTVAEAGYPGYSIDAWFGLSAPAGTPQPIVDKIHREVVRVLSTPDARDRLAAGGSEVVVSESPAAYTAFINAEIDRWEKLAKSTGMRG